MLRITIRSPKQLDEAQVFRDTHRMLDAITIIIDRIKKQPNPDPLALSPLVYSIIAGLTPGADVSAYTPELEERWERFFGNVTNWGWDGTWAFKEFAPQQHSRVLNRSGHKLLYNFYITLEKTSDNIAKFGSLANSFSSKLKELSEQLSEYINFKTHKQFDMLLTHNDSIKVYYKQKKYQQIITDEIRKWFSDNGIRITDRTHENGIDTENPNGSSRSYGQILADAYSRLVVDSIRTKFMDRPSQELAKDVFRRLPIWIRKQNPEHLTAG